MTTINANPIPLTTAELKAQAAALGLELQAASQALRQSGKPITGQYSTPADTDRRRRGLK